MEPEPSDSLVTFYTVCTPDYFLGLLGLINSLRQVGHRERLVVLDCGLSTRQLESLRGYCHVVKPPVAMASNATMYKAFGRLLCPHGVAVIIDSDMIVTRRIDGILAAARSGKICVFTDPEDERWFAEWASIFDLASLLRRQAYMTASFVVFSTAHWPNFLERWWACCERIITKPSIYEGAPNSDPVAQADQDALNAILMSEIPEEAILRLPDTDLVQCAFRESEALDVRTLECSYAGGTPFLLHWCGRPKPWDLSHWKVYRIFDTSNPYILLLRRLLAWDDLLIRIPRNELPLPFRAGALGAVVFHVLGAVKRFVFDPIRPIARTLGITQRSPGQN